MSLTLDSNLQTAQDSQTHHMVAELLSYPPVSAIPFDGYKITDTSPEYRPKLLVHSSGRIVYVYGTEVTESIWTFWRPRWGYTDTDRTVWTHGQLFKDAWSGDKSTGADFKNAALVEMSDGKIGILLVLDTYELHYQILNADMTLGASGLVRSWSTGEKDLSVITLAGGSYLYARAGTDTTPDPDEFALYIATSSDFATWGSETLLKPTGLGANPIENPYLVQDAGGDLFCFFNYVDSYSDNGEPLHNIYYIKSTDSGSSWGAPVKVTNFTTYGTIGYNPVAIQHTADQLLLSYRKKSTALAIGHSTSGWGSGNADDGCFGLAYDETTKKILHMGEGYAVGDHDPSGLTLIDVDTWAIEDTWNESSSPVAPCDTLGDTYKFNSMAKDAQVVNGKVAWYGGDTVVIVDTINDTVQQVNFYGSSQNITWDNHNGTFTHSIAALQLTPDGKLWVAWWDTYGANESYILGWLDINEASSTFTWNEVIYTTGLTPWYGQSLWEHHVNPDNGTVTLCTGWSTDDNYEENSRIQIWDLDSGARLKYYDPNVLTNMPLKHYWSALQVGDYLYVTFNQETIDTKRGLMRIDTTNDNVDYILPPWSGNYEFLEVVYVAEINCLCLAGVNGLATYNLGTGEWLLYDNNTMPNLTPTGTNWLRKVQYNADDDMFICAYYTASGSGSGVIMFPRSGDISQIMYMDGTYSGGAWSFGSEAKLIQDVNAYAQDLAYVPSSSEFYIMWEDFYPADDTRHIKWDKNELYADLTPYLVKGKELSVRRSIDGTPAELKASLSHGHLFDYHNLTSLLRPYLKKGRKLTLRLGEKVSGTDYWVEQGIFYVERKSVSYERGRYPIINIGAQDLWGIIGDKEVVATSHLSQTTPETAFSEIAKDHGGYAAGDITGVGFTGSFSMDVQFVDKTLHEILFTIANRFGYVPRIKQDGKLTVAKLGKSSIDHTYSDAKAVLSIEPDDSFSDYTNRVTVTGIEPQDTEVLHTEEKVGHLNGSVGWWKHRKEFDVYYSEDKEKRVMYPRLKVIDTATSIGFRLAGGVDEQISYEDPDYKFCRVEVDAPDLTAALLAAIGVIVGGANVGDIETNYGKTIPLGTYITNVGMVAALQILGSVANFQYEIWGRPVGYIRRTMQNAPGSADDTELINYLGHVIEKILPGWQCFSQAHCAAYANHELNVLKWQRSRVKIKKIGHLQDEEADTLRVTHPISGQTMDIFVTDIERRLTLGDGGGMADHIEGWVL